MTPDEDTDFSAFVASASPRLRRFAFAHVQDWTRADDAVQTTFERVARAWHRIDDRDPYYYARTVLQRLLVSEARRRWSRSERASGLLPGPDLGVDDDYPSHSGVLPALLRLSPMQRTVIVLRFYEDSSVDETAAALGCSAGNVKRHTHDAIRRLSELIELDGEPTVGPAKKGSARDER